MSKKAFFILALLVSFAPYGYPAGPLEPFRKQDRILILAPHPDDEALGACGVIQQALSCGAKVKVLYLTNGDHNQFAFIVYAKRLPIRKAEFIHLGEVRRRESIKAMQLLGLSEKDLIFLGYPDFGTFTIFSRYWETKKPFRSLLTRISRVPYKEDLSFGAPYTGESILADIKRVLLDYKPNKVFVTHPADVNVDHKSFYLFLQVALADLRGRISYPKIYPYLIHRVGWPLPRHYHPQLALEPPKEFIGSAARWFSLALTPEQLEKKHQAILCYKSQTESSAFYLLAFARKNELFGDYPEIILERQDPAKGKVTFSDFSEMYVDAPAEVSAEPQESGAREKGEKGNVAYALSGSTLYVRIDKPQGLKNRLNFVVYLFGYSRDKPFARMPKLRLLAKHDRVRAFDKGKEISPAGICIKSVPESDVLMLAIPLAVMGNPEFILSSIRSYGATLSVDATSFRKIRIR